MREIRPITRQSTIAVAAPSSAALQPEDARIGLDALYARGLTVVTQRPLDQPPHGYLSASDETRASELNSFFARDDIDGIFCLRGGYGAHRILDQIDYDAARKNPKLLVGYSDITALQLGLLVQAGIPSISGPMVAPDWPKMGTQAEDHFWSVAGGANPVEMSLADSNRPLVLKSGVAKGPLIGGNLTIFCSLLGTSYMPDLSGAILFLEDVGEKTYQIDRMLASLKLAGVLERIGGLAFGTFTHAEPRPGRPSLSVEEVLNHYATFVDGPVINGVPYGHFPDKCAIPIGVPALLEAGDDSATLTTLESVTRNA